MADVQDGLELIRRAFDLARASGRSDWRRMSLPVLKNRILHITARNFLESEYGASSFRRFLEMMPAGSIEIDDTNAPPAVNLLPSSDDPPPPEHRVFAMVRPDLWRAVLDYSSKRRYVWDLSSGRARPAETPDEVPVLPTTDTAALAKWRNAFKEEHDGNTVGSDSERLQRWAADGLPTAFLPAKLRPLWSIVLKERVTEILRSWFRDNRIGEPADLLVQTKPTPAADDVEGLRDFVVKCVALMSEQELRAIPVPASVALRASNKR